MRTTEDECREKIARIRGEQNIHHRRAWRDALALHIAVDRLAEALVGDAPVPAVTIRSIIAAAQRGPRT